MLPELVNSGPILSATGLVHRVLEPRGPGPYPTVVMLHGRYGNEDVMWIFKDTIPAHWLTIAPRAIRSDPWRGYSWVLQEHGEWPPVSEFDEAADAVADFIKALPRLYNVDLNRLYLMGFSQGAATAYAVALRYPGLIKGIAGLVGFVPEACDELDDRAGLEDLPVFMAVGREDKRVPHERALQCADVLRSAGAALSYHEYDTGHKLNREGIADLTSWWRERE